MQTITYKAILLDSPLKYEKQLNFTGHELLLAINHLLHSHTSSSQCPGGKSLLTTAFSFIFFISKAKSTSDFHVNLENCSLFPLLRSHSFLKINMVENSAVKNLKDFKYHRRIFLTDLSVSMIPHTPRWSIHLSNCLAVSPQTTTLSFC